MTNPLIPNTFVPGTKAKAEEVNANFIALADELQNTQANTDLQFSGLEKELSENITSIKENYLSVDASNAENITNTILEAPYGVAVYDGQTITVQSGVRVLIPNGKTTNGRLKNLEYITETSITKTITNLTNVDTAVFLYNTGNIEIIPQNHIFYKNSTPSTLEDNVHWYNIDENKWYKYILSEAKWVEVFALPIANASWNESSMISVLQSSQPMNMVKMSDLDNFYTLRGILPRDLDYVVERYKDNWEQYTVYKSGWVKQSGYCEGKGDSIVNFYVPMTVPYNIAVSRLTGASNSTSLNIWVRNDVTSTYIKVYTPEITGKIWSVEGYRQNIEEI